MSFSDQSDPTRNRNFRAFWRSRDPFFRDAAITLPPIPAAARTIDPADRYGTFLARVQAELKREGGR